MPVALFAPDHPVVLAQRTVDAVIDIETPTFGVYGTFPQPRINVLADIRAVAGRALSYATRQDLEAVIPSDLIAAYRDASELDDPERFNPRVMPPLADTKPGLAAPARAAVAAVGAVAALRVLNRVDVASAGDALRWLVASSRERGLAVSATNIGWGRGATPVLTGVQLGALGPMLGPSDQLRYRIGTPLPSRPTSASERATRLASRLPSMLWPTWSLRLSLPNCHQRQLRPALSAALLVVGSRFNLDGAARSMGGHVSGPAVSRVLQLLEKHDRWTDIRAVLVRMADHMSDHDVPIDYQRRRRLDYTTLLPGPEWASICRDTATPGDRAIRARIARCYLYERLSGLPLGSAPFADDDNAFRSHVADFPQYLTPELAWELDEHALQFLADHGVNGEPVVWRPPASVLDGLNLPEGDPGAVEIAELHKSMTVCKRRLGTAAARLGTSLDVVRFLLEAHPAPRLAEPTATQSRSKHGHSYLAAKAALPRDRLEDLYQRQGKPLREIALTVGADRKTIARLARDYGIPIREPQRTPRVTVERDWLHDQYVVRNRTLPDIASELGMSTMNLNRWAKAHGIALRPRGGGSHRQHTINELEAMVPALLRPAFATDGGWERLRRFAAASAYPTIIKAARALAVHAAPLTTQIHILERDLGGPLLTRAQRAHPMVPTPLGEKVITAIEETRSARDRHERLKRRSEPP